MNPLRHHLLYGKWADMSLSELQWLEKERAQLQDNHEYHIAAIDARISELVKQKNQGGIGKTLGYRLCDDYQMQRLVGLDDLAQAFDKELTIVTAERDEARAKIAGLEEIIKSRETAARLAQSLLSCS